MRTAWVVQTNVEPESTSPAVLRRACQALDLPFFELSVVPRSPELPMMPRVDGPVVLHGRTTLILRALEHPIWQRGIFFDPETFQHRVYAAHYGARMLNADARIVPWSELSNEVHPPGEHLFLKPNDDLKHFTGGVFPFQECVAMYNRLIAAGAPLTPATEVVVARPREIDAEWRLFMVNGKAVAGSMYRPSGDAHLPGELLNFAEETAARWVPAEVFVLDVARAEGSWRIVECNCFNGSRFYLADVERIVEEVSAYQETRW